MHCSRIRVNKTRLYESLCQIYIFKSVGGAIIIIGVLIYKPFIWLGLVVSAAIFPFHFWFLRSFIFIPLLIVVIGGWATKVLPILIITIVRDKNLNIIIVLRLVTSTIGAISIVSRFSIKSILIRSSLTQVGLVICSLQILNPVLYLSVYYLIRLWVCLSSSFWSWWILSALPPSPLFFLKVVILLLISSYSVLRVIILVICISISLYPYLKFIIRSKN